MTLISVGWLTAQGSAQSVFPVSDNGQFRTDLTSWNATNANASVLRSVTGNGKLQLNGAVGVWQYVPVSGLSDLHLVNCQAYKQLKSTATTSAPGWAGIGIYYYDSQWGFIDSFETQINVSNSVDLLGESSLVPCSLGTKIPPDAVHSIFWVSNDDANSVVLVDNLYLLDYFEDGSIYAPNSFGTYPTFLRDVFGMSLQTSGLEFWKLQGSIDTGTGAIGTVGQTASISREFTLTPGQSYSLDWLVSNSRTPDAPKANTGIDFFDATWRRIGGSHTTMVSSGLSFDGGGTVVDVPADTVHSIVWVWVDALTANTGTQQVGPIQLTLKPLDTTPPVLTLAQPVLDRTVSDRGLAVILNYKDNQPGEPIIFSEGISMTGPTAATYYFGWEYASNDEDPSNWFIKIVGYDSTFRTIDWSQQPIGTYTLTIAPYALKDLSNNSIAEPFTVSFQNLGTTAN